MAQCVNKASVSVLIFLTGADLLIDVIGVFKSPYYYYCDTTSISPCISETCISEIRRINKMIKESVQQDIKEM